MINSIKNKKFLQKSQCELHWCGSDSKKRFEENLKLQPENWFYRNNIITYKLNSEGYRTQEFDLINWSESVVVIGCSHVFGTGLADEHTIPGRLSSLLNIPVINLGYGSTSIDVALHNSTILRNFYPTPFAVIQLWTSYDRCTYYSQDEVEHYTPTDLKPGNYLDLWTKDNTHPEIHALMAQAISKNQWENQTRYFEASLFDSTAKLLNCKHYSYTQDARDCIHPGISSCKKIAEDIADNLLRL